MGRKKLERPPLEDLYATVCKMLVPGFILADFDIYGAVESPEDWVIELREKEGLLPQELASCPDAVFDGFCNPLLMLSHSFVCKPIYLKIYRRRYKSSHSSKHYSNDYDLTLKGLRMVPELGIFLKE